VPSFQSQAAIGVAVLTLPLVLCGCFAELVGGPGFVSGGATGVGVSVGVVAGVQYDIAQTARIAPLFELHGISTQANNEKFQQYHTAFGALTDIKLVSLVPGDRHHPDGQLRLRLAGAIAPWTSVTLTPDVSRMAYKPPSDPTTYMFAGGLGFEMNAFEGSMGAGVDLRVDHIPSSWMGDTTIVTPQLRFGAYANVQWVLAVLFGAVADVDASNIQTTTPYGGPKVPDKNPSHADEDIRKANDRAREIQQQQLKDNQRRDSCSRGGPC
jgi:hypothetical protein